MGCIEEHNKMKAWHVKIDIDHKGVLEQIVRNYGILYTKRK